MVYDDSNQINYLWFFSKFLKKRIIYTKGEFHRRVTRHIRLQPFSLQETQQFLKTRGFDYYSIHDIVELYMCLGGIPYYLNLLQKGLYVHQNIHQIFFGARADSMTSELSRY